MTSLAQKAQALFNRAPRLMRNLNVAREQVRHDSTKVERVMSGEDWTKVYIQENKKWVGARMARDVKRRQIAKDFAPLRARLISMKRNDILPFEIKELVVEDMKKVPRQAALRQLRQRCAFTSRGYGNVLRWRVSRFVFRDLADHNRIAGMQRAMW